MSNAHKGSRLKLKDQVIPVDFSTAHFDFNHDATGIHYGNLIEPSSSSVYTLRPIDGKFGGGVAIEEATTNLCPINDSWQISKSNYQGVCVITTGQNDFSTSARFEFKPRLDGSTSGWQVAQYVSAPKTYVLGDKYTFSFYAKTFTGHSIRVSIRDGNGLLPAMDYTTCEISYEWKRYSFTFDALHEGSNQVLYITSDENSSFEIADPQVEKKGFSTSFVNGTRNHGSIYYPIVLNPPFTIGCWVKSNGGISDYLYDTRNSTTGGYGGHLIYTGGSGGNISWLTSNGSGWDTISSSVSPFDGNWNHILATIDGSLNKSLYVNGKLQGERAAPSIFISGEGMYVGTRYSLANSLNSTISDLLIDNKYYTRDEVETLYISEKPLYNPYDYRSFAY